MRPRGIRRNNPFPSETVKPGSFMGNTGPKLRMRREGGVSVKRRNGDCFVFGAGNRSQAARSIAPIAGHGWKTASSGRETLIAMGTKIYTYAGNSCRNSNVVAVGCGLFVDNTFLASSAFSNREYAVDLFMYLTDTGE